MNHCGLDVATKSSYLYVTDQKGNKLTSGEVETEREALRRRLSPYLRGGLRIAIEAGNQTAWIHELLVEMGADVVVVNPAKVKMIAESRKKTDKIDAKILCELLRLNALPHPVHMPGKEVRELRGLLTARRQLVTARTKLVNVVRGLVRQEGIQLGSRELLSAAGWERLGRRTFQSAHLAAVVEGFARSVETLTESIRKLEKELAQREKKDERAARLQTMPSVGRIGSLTFLAAVDRIERFPSARKLVGYSGLAPSVRASGDRVEYGSISREGRSDLRAVWVQIAHLVARDTSPEARPLRSWYLRTAKRRGVKTAMVALARRLLVIAYHMLTKQRDYDPKLLRKAG
jgi:transposase